MIAVIGDSAQTPSIELHRALGFRMIGALENVGFKFGRWLDSVLMQRALGDGATTTPSAGGSQRIVQPNAAAYTATSRILSSARSTRSSSWPRRTIRPVAEITL